MPAKSAQRLLYACRVLYHISILCPVVWEAATVTSLVSTILIGSQLLKLVMTSFGSENYMQQFLESNDSEFQVFLILMLVLFVHGFVFDSLETIYIVIPIAGPVIRAAPLTPNG